MHRRRHGLIWLLPVAIIGLFLVFVLALAIAPEGYLGKKYRQPAIETRRLVAPEAIYDLQVAETPQEQAQGLSGVQEMRPGYGMLFVNPREDTRCIWMKDMLIPIDIIWLNSNKRIVYLQENVSPDTYPQTYCARAQYVIELEAGEADRNGFRRGQTLRF